MRLFSVLLVSAFPFSAIQAAVIYSEAGDGEISATATAPTSLGALALGDNDVIGQIGGNSRDYFTFTVGGGLELDAITLVSGSGSNHFFGFDDQNTFNNSGGFLIGTLFSAGVGESADFLDTFAGGGNFGGSGVTGGSLPAGDYTVLINEVALGPFEYHLRLTTATVPEPSSALMLGLGALGLITVRRRR